MQTIVENPGTIQDMPMRPSFNSAIQIISSPSFALQPGIDATFIYSNINFNIKFEYQKSILLYSYNELVVREFEYVD